MQTIPGGGTKEERSGSWELGVEEEGPARGLYIPVRGWATRLSLGKSLLGLGLRGDKATQSD